MEKFKILIIFGSCAALQMLFSTVAMANRPQNLSCPTDGLEKGVFQDWIAKAAAAEGILTQAQLGQLVTESKNCAQQMSWNETQRNWALEINLAMIGKMAIEENLYRLGINDIFVYGNVLDGLSVTQLEDIVQNPSQNLQVQSFVNKIKNELGARFSPELSNNVINYLIFSATYDIAVERSGND